MTAMIADNPPTLSSEDHAGRQGALDRLRRSIEHARGESGADRSQAAVADDELDLRVQLMLLREENARLKSELYRPADVGTAISRLRALASSTDEAELGDRALGLLAQALAVSAGVERACIELEAAAGAVRARLGRLALAADEALLYDLPESSDDDDSPLA